VTYEITDELIEELEPDPPCDYCDGGRVSDVDREGPNGDDVKLRLCTSCWMTEDGSMFLPPDRRDDRKNLRRRRGVVVMNRDEQRSEYRKSDKKIMCGAHPAYDDVGEDYGLDDGTSDYENFVTA